MLNEWRRVQIMKLLMGAHHSFQFVPFLCVTFVAASTFRFELLRTILLDQCGFKGQWRDAESRRAMTLTSSVAGRTKLRIRYVIISFLSTLNQELLQINTFPWITQLPYVKDFFQPTILQWGLRFSSCTQLLNCQRTATFGSNA